MAAKHGEALLHVAAICPNVHVSANGIASSIQISRMFVIGFGFSNGCEELAL